ncbi:putative phage antirepressor [Fusobacterium varium]|jgi:anti-repressor protein|uniref:phage antirepressor KilAC domain-containing protein n=1 Tax=Fusobacterium ulcerans TaxID=861 RepID=UPI000BBB2AC3|nr:phage antirepressor KilAC domain-containing protein [Fusobacterium ulcerans]RGY61903.1 oxidoreductase [Fusobacterium ulcerans]BBA51697.1 putative phage antirepressor [Fusobacterium varium]
MNELIKIEERNGEQLVSARELHKFLEVKTEFKIWIARIIEKYNFIENKDFVRVYQKCNTLGGEQEKVDYLLKISTAKEVAMVSNTPKGKEAREYFIKCEEAWNSPDMILARANQIQSKMLESYKDKVIILEEKIEQDKPKVIFAEAVEASKTSILIGELAKLLKQNGHNIGQKRLFSWLREQGFLIKREGSEYNMPTQKSMDLGLFEIKETAITHSDGHITVNKTPKVTGKGQIYFMNKFKTAA